MKNSCPVGSCSLLPELPRSTALYGSLILLSPREIQNRLHELHRVNSFSRCGPKLQLEPSKTLRAPRRPSKEALFRILGIIASPAWPRSTVNPRSPQGRALCGQGLTAKARAEP
jgi:hypothetical protein